MAILANNYKLPEEVLTIIDHYTSMPVPLTGLKYPSAAAYAESTINSKPERSHMGIFEGLPLSPFLANVMIHNSSQRSGMTIP